MLTEIQQDALAELFNVFVGRAAGILSEMTERRIELSVPVISLLPANEVTPSFITQCIGNCSGHLMSSSVQFGQSYSGKAFLLFPSNQAKLLVNLCLNGGRLEDEAVFVDERSLVDTDFDVMKEIGNIILNSVVGGLGNLLAVKLTYTLPEVEMIFVSPDKQVTLLRDNIYVLLLKTVFSIANTQFRGAILIVFGMDSVSRLIAKIDDMLEGNDASAF